MAKVFMEDEELNDVMDTEEVIDCGDDSDVDETIPAEEETTSSIEEPEQKDASEEKNSGDPTENEEEVTTEPEEDVDSEFSVDEDNTDSDTDSTGGEDDSSNTDDEVEDDSDIDNDIMTLPLDSEEGLVTEQADDIPPGKRWDTYDENEDDIEDTDEIMALDTSSGSNKRLPFSKIGDWLVNKLTNAVIKNLQTQNQTVIGAINELNSNCGRTLITTLPNTINLPTENCKYLCSLMEPYTPYTIVGQNGSRALVYGFTYTKSEDAKYALFFYSYIGSDDLYLVRCYNGKWTSTNLVK